MLRVVELMTVAGSVRLIEGLSGGPLWVGNDVARLAGYKVPRDAVRDHCPDRRPLDALGLSVDPQTQLIGPAGVRVLLSRSRSPQAAAVAEWFREEGFRVAAASGPFDRAAPADAGADQVAVVPPSAPAPAGQALTAFSFDGAAVRVVEVDGDPWFVLADVCRVLEIGNPSQAATRLDDDEKALLSNNEGAKINGLGGFGNSSVTIINESGLYSLILTSRKPSAKRFKKWVAAEVLPAIRKTGHYGAAPAPAVDLDNPDQVAVVPPSDPAPAMPVVSVKDGAVYANSRDVAAFFGKQHKDVLRSIDGLGCSPEFAERNFALSEYLDPTGRSLRSYNMTKDGFTFLVMGFTGRDAARFKEAYIQRFNEMEDALRRQPVAPAPAVDLDNPDHLRSLLLHHTTKRIEAERALAVAAPKAETLDRIAGSDYEVCISDAAKVLGLPRNKLFGWLEENGWIYRRNGSGRHLPYREREESGQMRTRVDAGNGGKVAFTSAVITAKGLIDLVHLVPGAALIQPELPVDLLDWTPGRTVTRQ